MICSGISDIRAFGSISEGRVFARAEGCPSGYAEMIADLDAALSDTDRFLYKRITSFPKLTDSSLIGKYSEIYGRFASGEKPRLGNLPEDICVSFSDACRMVMDRIGKEMPSMTEGIMKNLGVSLFYWGDIYLPDLTGKDRKGKFVCSGKIGYREYAFCMALCELGIDVLMLLPEGDIRLSPSLLSDSCLIRAGERGRAEIPEPARRPVRLERSDRKTAAPAPKPVDISRPDRKTVRPADISGRGAVTGAAVSAPAAKRELEYEEIAELSSSVVMIAVIDREGDIIGSGSGIAISEKGYILTNFHVIRDGALFAVRLENDEKVYETCDVVKYHPEYDLAIIRIGAKLKPIRICPLGSELKRGQKIAAIGSPLGLFNTLSDGIISGFRNINNNEMIQFTAPISGGSSGGAILNMYGEVIGISTAGFADGQNLNLAVSFKDIRAFAGNFIEGQIS